MNTNAFPSRTPRRRQEDGIAIILVLAFLVLLTGLVFAFFSRAITERQVANSSLNQSKADILARSAVDVIVGDLKQEIVDGSVSPAPTPAPGVTLYLPKTPVNMLPQTSGTPAPIPNPSPSPATLPIPNLVRRSVRNDPLSPPAPALKAVSTSASAVNSYGEIAPDGQFKLAASTNGRYIGLARWNSHYLIPLRKPSSTSIDSTPISPLPATPSETPSPATSGFITPDWVMVASSGPKVLTAPDATAIGRYAYAIYDEGGLLDINVVGYPSQIDAAKPSSKLSLAFADLSALPYPIPKTASSPNPPGSSQVDQIVGWRNYASVSQPSASASPAAAASPPQGSFPNYILSAQNANNYWSALLGLTSGSMTVSPTKYKAADGSVRTDQAFTSRQALLSFRRATDFSQNALQYLTHFSRALEQPSFMPAHIQNPTTAPSINDVAATAPPAASSADSYLGNNDAAGSLNGVAGQDLINPSILTVRVAAPFTRQDINKTPAVVGEPLVKRRFALGRLAEITYSATDATASVTDTAFTNGNHIKDWFGLSRTDASKPWTYNHGADKIMTLAEVSAANREPDFAELLKAAINVGSLGKGGPNLPQLNSYSNYQYALDTTVDYQVLHIMANLIDQYDADSYPTVLQIANGNSPMRAFRGVEDLPYFYRYHPFSVVTKLPDPLLEKGDVVKFYKKTDLDTSDPNNIKLKANSTPVYTLDWCRPGAVLPDPGEAVMLYVPEVWNPHDANTAKVDPKDPKRVRPTSFRLVAITADPLGLTKWQTNAVGGPTRPKPLFTDGQSPPLVPTPPPYADMTEESTAFTFSDDNGNLFREPTMLWRGDAPTKANVAAAPGALSGPHVDFNTKVSYLGTPVGKTPTSFNAPVSNSYVGEYKGVLQLASNNYNFQFDRVSFGQSNQAGSGQVAQLTFRLQYLDPNGKWITYDEKYPDFHGLESSHLVVNKKDYDTPTYPVKNAWMNPMPYTVGGGAGQISDNATAYDPRTARFGIGTQNNLTGAGVKPVLEAQAMAAYNLNDASLLVTKFTVLVTQRPNAVRGNQVNYSNPAMTSDTNGGRSLEMRWFSGRGFNAAAQGAGSWPLEYDGVLFGNNNPAITMPARTDGTPVQLYYEDADGVARRAMGAYADTALATTDSLVGQPLATANTYTDNGPASGKLGVGTPKTDGQSQSRPLVLNRPFRSVAEMSYAFRGTPWKQIDFFTPESGDAFLLDTFCLNEPPPTSMVAGKVNLNTRQAPVIQALLAGAYRDEQSNYATPPSYALDALGPSEAGKVGAKLVSMTTDTTAAWRGPLTNVGELVGRFVPNPGSTGTATDLYTFKETVTGKSYTYAGLSAALDKTVYTAASASGPKIQRMREAAIRPLANNGQTRVWNLMIDVIAQTGRYGPNAIKLNKLDQFTVDGEKRYWVHVAIDRFTGDIIDKQVEAVTE